MTGATERDDKQASPNAQGSTEEAVEAIGKVESKTPGRMRVRLKPELRTPEAMAQIQDKLNDHEHVREVAINQRTGSITITHDKQHDGHKVFFEALQESELLAEVVLDFPEEGGDHEGRFGKLDNQLANLIYRVDYAVYRKTKLRFRGQIVAGAIAAAGVAQMVVYGISLEMLPGPVLLWIGWDIYHRVAQEPPFPTDAGVEYPPAGAPAPEADTAIPAAA